MEIDNANSWKLLIPLVSGYAVSFFCKISNDEGSSLPQTPPSYVFGIIWPLLYILVGLSWYYAEKNKLIDFLHPVCIFLLALWIYIYNCQNMKKMGIYIIASTISIVICLMSLHNHKLSKVYLSPLLAWLLVAFHLNWDIVK